MPTNSTRDGYGLGLSIVQRIANLLGAKLDVQSELGKASMAKAGYARGRMEVEVSWKFN